MKNTHGNISISTLLYRHSPALLVFAVIIGATAGFLYSLIIPFVLHELNGSKTGAVSNELLQNMPHFINEHRVGFFFMVCLLILVTKACSVILVNNIAKSATAGLRLRIANKINHMMIDNVEKVGFPRLLNILIDDVNNVAAAAITIPMVVVAVVTVLGMLGYLATLSIPVFLIVLAAIFIGIAMFQIPVSMATGLYTRARILRDVIQEGIRGLVLGVYELKLNRGKSAHYIEEELVVPQQESVRLEKIGDGVIHLAGTSSDLLCFFIIGLIVFVMPGYIDFATDKTYGVVMALLYIAGPVAQILGMMQHLRVGQVALERIRELDEFGEEPFLETTSTPLPAWREYRVDAVSYRYPQPEGAQEAGFALQPVSLSFQPGQINFIVGGNGSGKSTLSKLLSLHYLSSQGHVYFDDLRIDSHNITQARARISVIFSNYYLFKSLYRPVSEQDKEKISGWLDALGLTGKTEFVDGRFTTTKLSDGQRRRLALLVSLLEDKDIYIFDEWAADQDPGFKKIFYQTILPDMKRNNKLVIVITHDDRYFDCADRVIFMEDGKMIGVQEADPHSAPRTGSHSFLPDSVMAGAATGQ